MEKKYLAKIIANDNEGLQTISACCSGAKIKISNIKYLQSNKIFLRIFISVLIVLGLRFRIVKFPLVKTAAIRYVPASMRSNITA